ncbi:MAG: penicillin-binding transpeptidase domain-containing protein [Faecalibacterium sp.]
MRPAGPTPISASGRGSCWHPPAGRRHDEHHCLRGICRTPLLLETTLDETTGTPLTALSHVRSRRVLTKRTAAALQALLAGVVAGGTGHEAALPGQTAAGKTGTAQTGQFSGGTELKNYWFAGFVPAEQPRYTIVVLQDTQAEPAFSSAAIFARVAAGLEILAP